jgi:hypothetical protein
MKRVAHGEGGDNLDYDDPVDHNVVLVYVARCVISGRLQLPKLHLLGRCPPLERWQQRSPCAHVPIASCDALLLPLA